MEQKGIPPRRYKFENAAPIAPLPGDGCRQFADIDDLLRTLEEERERLPNLPEALRHSSTTFCGMPRPIFAVNALINDAHVWLEKNHPVEAEPLRHPGRIDVPVRMGAALKDLIAVAKAVSEGSHTIKGVGPQSSGMFHWAGEAHRLPNTAGRIVAFMWERNDAEETDLEEAVWGPSGTSKGNLYKQISDANRALLEIGYSERSLHQKSGRVFWD